MPRTTGCEDDEAAVAWLVKQAGVCIIPGSSCGAPGYVRAAYANLPLEDCRLAAARLKAGLQQLVASQGLAALSVVRLAPIIISCCCLKAFARVRGEASPAQPSDLRFL